MPQNERPVVLITGASSGIGLACAGRLALARFEVWAGKRALDDGISPTGDAPALRCLQLDVTRRAEIDRAARELAAHCGKRGLAGLVNNAGLAQVGALETMSIARFRELCEVNLVGLAAVTQAMLPLLRQGRGRVINVGSVSGAVPRPFLSGYSATKAGLEALSDAWRAEFRPFGVSVSLLRVGRVRTPIWPKAAMELSANRHTVTEQSARRYAPVVRALQSWIERDSGIAPEGVADLVEEIMRAAKPRSCYEIGSSPRERLLRRLPTALRDWLVGRKLPRYD